MIQNVTPGEQILASQMNAVIDSINALNQPLGLSWEDLVQESNGIEALPWHVDENTLSVYRPIVYINGEAQTASQYSDMTTEGGTLPIRDHGSFYVGYNDLSSTVKIYDSYQKDELESQEASQPVKHWSFKHVYDVIPLSVVDDVSAAGPFRAAYFDIRPTFGESGGSINLDLSSLDWADISVQVSDPTSETGYTTEVKTVAENWHYASLSADDKVDIANISDAQDFRFLARPEAGGTLKYASLSSILSTLSSEGGGGGGGECSCSMSAIVSAETYQDQSYRTNTQIAQFKDCQGNTTNVYAPDSVRFQGNVGARQKTGWTNSFAFETMTSSNVQIICQGNTIQCGCYYI